MRYCVSVLAVVTGLAATPTVHTRSSAPPSANPQRDPREDAQASHPSLEDLGLPAGDAVGACTTCHESPPEVTHPVGVVPSMQVPRGFPLDPAGRTTCLTCHDVPGQAGGPGTGVAFFLRRERPDGPFCTQCHRQQPGARRNPHASPGQAAHGGSLRASRGSTAAIDDESASCMGCHDGSIAGEADIEIRPAADAESGPGIGRSHPVGVEYQAARHGTSLAPSGPGSVVVRLYAGRVSCGSCHSPFSVQPKMLVMSNQGDALCLTCHKT